MKTINDDEVRAIIERVRHKMGATNAAPTAPPQVGTATGADGIHATVDSAVEACRKAFETYRSCGLDGRHRIVDRIRQVMREHVVELSEMAHSETGLGRTEDKIKKNSLVIDKAPGPEDLEPQTWTGDRGLTLTEPAPFGIIGAITPTTNPTATIINNTIAGISAGNGVVFNAHPNAKAVSAHTIRLINGAVTDAGGPANLVAGVAEPTIASAQALMHHPGVRILLITGGPGVVAEAQKTTKRAILAGPGNPPVVVDETADLELAGREIVRGASFDNNLICTDEKEVFVVASVADALLDAMRAAGAYVLAEHELAKLDRVVFKEAAHDGTPGKVNPKLIGQNAGDILAEIGVRNVDHIRLVVADVPVKHSLLWTEQMMPVMPVARVPDVDRAISLAIEAEHGCCHTASIFSRNVDTITRMAREIDVSIFVANASTLAGLGDGGEGFTSFSIASPTGEGLTRPRSLSRERRLAIAGGLRIV
ncbi:MAG: aldehyde dehydrogenase family protein [Thermoanaerobaculales bacterium]|jgi:acyl-CoA reductase-like NAD-dependent aldehyde dehydrogenase|nr:aldehyde dehydrogenase family protein [Thermoanaerobaculales bacterium]